VNDVENGQAGSGPRCADWARDVGVDPIGTAVSARGFLLLDWPLPWPRDASEIAALEPVRTALVGTGIRLQLVVPRPDADRWSIVRHDLGPDEDGWFSGYRRRAVLVEPSRLIESAVALLTGPDADDQPEDQREDRPAGAPTADPGLDVLICGHGSRDRCCGSMGTALAMAATAAGLAIRRTSHTGGHRFAPTGLILPHGTAWAFLDDDALDRIISMRGPVDDLLDRYRGSSAFATPAHQAAERVAFGAVGWPWLQHRRRATDLEPTASGHPRVLVEGIDAQGRLRSWRVELTAGRTLPVPECGKDPATAPKSETEVVITGALESTPA
jgi:hypothetical protein